MIARGVTRRFDALAEWITRAGPGKWAIGLSMMALLARLPIISSRSGWGSSWRQRSSYCATMPLRSCGDEYEKPT